MHLPGALTALFSMKAFHSWAAFKTTAMTVVHFVALHTGLPMLVVAALLIAIGYRVLKKTARFAIEVAAIGLVLVLVSELGWIRW